VNLAEALAARVRSLLPSWITAWPLPKQALFMALPNKEAFYGGAAGGGKSYALLLSALQFAEVPGYKAIIYRRTYPELSELGGLIDKSRELIGPHGEFNETRHEWSFASGARLRFGHMQHEKDAERHERGPEYQFIGFDELTTFRESMYRRMFSRLRGPSTGPLSRVPLRMRSASNPGAEGHAWVKQRFITEGRANGRAFVPAKFRENTHLDHEKYLQSLDQLDPVSRARMLEGDWDVEGGGIMFQREWFEVVPEAPAVVRAVRFWDCAATVNETSKYTAGALMGVTAERRCVIFDVKRFRARPGDREERMLAAAKDDTALLRHVPVRIEHEPGSSGVHQADDQVKVFAGYDVQVVRPLGSKAERAAPLARQAQNGNVMLVSSGPWIGPFLDELVAFPDGYFSDQVDAASGALNELTIGGPARAATAEAPARAATSSQVWGPGQRRSTRIFRR